MKGVYYLFFFLSLFSLAECSVAYPALVLNMENEAVLPRKFRMTTDALDSNVPAIGLDKLNASGSSQFSEMSLHKVLEAIPAQNVCIVDLRQESHGFIDGNAVGWLGARNWANLDKSLKEVEEDECARLSHVLSEGSATIHTKKLPHLFSVIKVREAIVESELVHRAGARYIRIPVTDHMRPTDAVVDRFVAFVNALEPNTWLHFHCSAGKGRATLFLILYDIMRNAKQVPLLDILVRQNALGGKDYTEPADLSSWKFPYDYEKRQFIEKFYLYCCQNDSGMTWSEWLSHNK